MGATAEHRRIRVRAGPLVAVVALVATLSALGPAVAGDVVIAPDDRVFPRAVITGLIDARTALTSDQISVLDNGLGKTRFGAETGEPGAPGDADFEPRLAEISLVGVVQPTAALTLVGHGQAAPEQDDPLDIVEGFARYRPVSTGRLRVGGQVGAFFPPVSVENVGPSWTSPYTMTNSAINSWIGEDLRVIGGEVTGEWRLLDGDGIVGARAGLFYANDGAATALANRGWALHDYKIGLFDELELPDLDPAVELNPTFEPFREIDEQPGYYLGVDLAHADFGELGLLYYDNRGQLGESADGQSAWRVRFLSMSGRTELPFGVEVLGQAMVGDAQVQPDGTFDARIEIGFGAAYLLASRRFDRQTVSARGDLFGIDDRNPGAVGRPVLAEQGYALTGAYFFEPFEQLRFGAEVLFIDSDRPQRGVLGLDERQREVQVQVGYRLSF